MRLRPGLQRARGRRAAAMGNCCWARCFGRLRREAGRLPRGGGSKYFRTCSRGEHLTIEFENLVESDEGESPGSRRRPLTEEEIIDLRERHYDSIAEKQKDLDRKIQKEERLGAGPGCRPSSGAACHSSGPEDNFESCLRNTKSQYEVFQSSRLSSDATVLTPNTESSCDLMTKTKSTSGNDDSTSLDLEWEDEEGMTRMLPVRERSRTEEDILRAALRGGRRPGSHAASASDDSNGLEWESDFVSADLDDNGNSEFSGFVNPVLDLSEPGGKPVGGEPQTRGGQVL
ncbi:AP-1 complex-associated regulatory protein isoform X5 [Pipistrellus kuhlii]|uniref:Adaptor related protein complex 1 associated regulatory protein n=1 Tax=Pipistrellus kuhlii TaxID=59472 RepID=A0A7J7U9G0_PIPKU|nr:AP-1 complex-associated regulatory protein isoform X5 [Pipistrellus kuhlii]KAF6309481.1 adaptor related protein complex 1 associated regulatory protein [Pipistrellus kuhlii]